MAAPSIAAHFERRDPVVARIYDRLLRAVRGFGPVTEDPKKTSIHWNRASAFAGIATRQNSIVLTIKAEAALRSPRVHKAEQTSAKRWHLQVKLTSPDDVDAELLAWLRTAYELSA